MIARIWMTFGLFLLGFFFVVFRLFYWQVVVADRLRIVAASQYFYELTIPASRGSIFASDGSPLVINQSAYLVYANPRLLTDPKRISRDLAPLLSLDPGQVLSLMQEPGRVWVPLAHKVESSVVDTIKALNLKGIGFEKEPRRYYVEASMAGQLLGFVGSDTNGNDKGYFGLEGYYDRELRGKDGVVQLEKDAKGAPILIGEAHRIEPQDGRSLLLWLDRAVQQIAQRRLDEGLRKYGAQAGSVVIMDPSTGGVLAMASIPNYDPARFVQFDKNLYKNPIVAGSFEPGSTFKTLMMSSALNERKVTPTTTMDEAPVQIGEYTIRTWNDQYHGAITMSQVLEYSSNVGMVFVGKKIGKEKIIDYIRAFGFGQPTGIDLEDESSPAIRSENDWKDIDLATASFGQGIAVTPLQMVRAVGALANGGWLMEPHAVKEIREERGRIIRIAPKRVRQVIDASSASVMTEMMIAAVDRGEARWAKPAGYRIAGKTGTAQIPVAGHYDAQKTIASFVGFAPADNPKFVMLVTLREPTSSPWGSETAAPLFFTIARDLFTYYGIPPQ